MQLNTPVRRSERILSKMAISAEQFERLMQAVMASNSKPGSFSTCTARFGGERNPSKVEEFISAISTFKAVEKISDEDAISGMPMLLEGDASEWWRGVKGNAENFSDVVKMVRDSFSPPKPAWRIYVELWDVKQQRNEPIDSFIRKKRALFALLSSPPVEKDQIDMLFGMIHEQIRDKLVRSNVNTYDDILRDGREAEQVLSERNKTWSMVASEADALLRCSFCRKKGHAVDKCFKKQKSELEMKQSIAATALAVTSKPKLACYGCNAPGYVRANCPTCSAKSGKVAAPVGVANFNSLTAVGIGRDIPIANVKLFGVPGQAYFDTGARTSVASSNLKRIMDFHSCKYNKVKCEVTLADGSTSLQECLSTICRIVIGGKSLSIKFIILPNATQNRTLLGADFLEQVGIVLNMGQKYWYFESTPHVHYDFAEAWPLNLNLVENIKVTKVHKRKPPETLVNKPKQYHHDIYVSEFESYGPEIPGTDYSPHSIHAIFKDSLRDNDTTPERNIKQGLFNGVIYSDSEHKDAVVTHLGMVDFKILKVTDGVNLNVDQKLQLDNILYKHEAVFGEIVETTPYAEHRINTGNNAPVHSPPYRLSFPKMRQLKVEVDKMLAMGIVEECESAWTSPVVMVPKKDGGVRVCVDYRKLNAITEPDRYPLPRMDDLLHAARSTQFMTTLDLQSGYYQIKVFEGDIDKTCFTTPFGLFHFTRMPFGLRNAPSTFQRLIDLFKAAIPEINLLAYLDDLIVCSATFDEHLRNLDVIFERLEKFNLRVNNAKCRFCCSEVKYLGHLLTPAGICVDPGKTNAIAMRREPRNLKELVSFIQTCSWYRRFINQFAEIAKPLTDLTKKNKPWIWKDPHRNAFQKLKSMLITSPILKQAEDGLAFIVKTDASAYAIGAVLLQGEGNDEHPIEFASRLLTSAEKNYSTTEREALAIVWACSKFRGYIEGADVILVTDHQPLKWLLSVKSPTGRLARWALQVQQHNFKIQYTPGRTNCVADMLSRPPCDNDTQGESMQIMAFQIDFPHKSAADARDEQLKDPYIKGIVESLESADDNVGRWTNRGYVINEGVLFCYNNDDVEDAQYVVPEQEKTEILKVYHDDSTAGHYGAERTIARIASRYFWPSMRSDITKYVRTCIECQRFKASNMKPVGLLQTTSSKHRFEVLAVDLFGPLPRSDEDYQWILITEDVATRWVELFPLKEATAEVCAKILIEEIFLRYGIPRRLKTDNGVQFVSAIMQKVTYCLGIQQQLTPVYHPEANPVERKNRDLKAQLAILVQTKHDNWPSKLPVIRFAMNTARCQTTGYTAAFLSFGRELRTLDDVQHDLKAIIERENFIPQISSYLHNLHNAFKNARETEQRAQDKNKNQHDQHRRCNTHFDVGVEVLVNTHVLSQASKGVTSKFVPKRDGPYIITRKVGATSYEIASHDNINMPLGTYHASALTLYKGTHDDHDAAPIHPIRKRGRPKKT